MQACLLLLPFLILTACSSKPDGTFKTLKVEYIENIPLSELIKTEAEYIPLKSARNYPIKEIDGILFSDTLIYALDSRVLKKVVAFDHSGNFKFAFGTLGAGIGEYGMPSAIALYEDELHLSDNGNFSLLKYGLDGQFREEIQTGLWISEFLSLNDHLIIHSPISFVDTAHFGLNTLRVFSSDYQRLESSFFPYTDVAGNSCYPGQISIFNNQVNFLRSYVDEVWTLKDNNVTPRFKIDFGKYAWPITEEEMNNDEDRFTDLFIEEDIMSVLHDVNETDQYFLFKTYMTNANFLAEEDEWMVIHEKGTNLAYAIHNVVNDLNDQAFRFPKTTWGDDLISIIPEKTLPSTASLTQNSDSQLFMLMRYELKPKMNLPRYVGR